MIAIQLICVGKLKEKFYADACSEYSKRLNSFCKLSMIEIPEERLPDNPSQAQIDAALLQEAGNIFAKIPKGSQVAVLCVEGTLLSSEQLAEKLESWALNGASSLAFVIGGSYGLHSTIKQKAALRLSMSPMTFPHHLARVMVLEQIYRAFQITKGTHYHK